LLEWRAPQIQGKVELPQAAMEIRIQLRCRLRQMRMLAFTPPDCPAKVPVLLELQAAQAGIACRQQQPAQRAFKHAVINHCASPGHCNPCHSSSAA
jgi:hypothetical protein